MDKHTLEAILVDENGALIAKGSRVVMIRDSDWNLGITDVEVRDDGVVGILDLSAEYDLTDRQLYAGLGVTEGLLSGESAYSGDRINLEVINTRFDTAANVSSQGLGASGAHRWWRGWANHTEIRDERVQIFADRLRSGGWSYTYLARATTPGTFTLAPARAEQMYSPENFGRSKTEVVVVSP